MSGKTSLHLTLAVGVLGVGSAICAAVPAQAQALAQEIVVIIGAGGAAKFDSPGVTIGAGGRVTWVHKGGGTHTVTPEADSPVKFKASGDLKKDDIFEILADEAGEIKYFCENHPTTMKGTVTVTAAE